MTLKLKPECRYECDPADWREVSVMAPGEDGSAPIVQARVTDAELHVTLRSYGDDGSEAGFAVVPCLVPELWEHRAHSELTVLGWFSPWVIP